MLFYKSLRMYFIRERDLRSSSVSFSSDDFGSVHDIEIIVAFLASAALIA